MGSDLFGLGYKAIRFSDKKIFCIKQSQEIEADEEEIFEKGFNVLKDLNHPNIIHCFETFLYKNYFYLV
jgi:hypothetical protein